MSNENQNIGEQDNQEQSTVKNIKRKRADQPDHKKKLISAITGTVMVAGAITPFLPSQVAQASPLTTTTGTLTADKYYVAAGEFVEITITDSGNHFNLNSGVAETTQVAVSSAADTDEGRNPLMLTLTETGPATGVFKGSLGLVDPSVASPAANVIKVANGGTVTILDPKWNTENQLNPIVLNVERRDHVTGAIQTLDAATLAPVSNLVHNGQVIRVELRDDDLNTSPTTIQSKTINVTATAGTPGYQLVLQESSANSNLFVGEFTVGTDINTANNSPFYIEYVDDNKVDNSSGLITKKLVRKDLSAATLSALPSKAAYNEPVTVTLTDNDLNIDPGASETAIVKVTSAEDSAGFSLTLTETGPDTGEFTGTFTMQNDSNPSLNHIKALNGSSVTVSYTDLRDTAGATNAITKTIARKDHISGTVSVDKSFAVVGENVTITVNDTDYVNTVPGEVFEVKVASISDPAGILVALTETADTGVFKGTFKITAGVSVPTSQISAVNGEAITVTYTDAITAGNETNQPVTATLSRKDRVTGAVSYDRLSSASGEIIEVTLNDTDLDVNSNAVETAQVTVTSVDDPTGFFLTMTETGNGTGIFKGQFKPVTTGSNGSLSPQELEAAYNSNMIVTYTDEHRVDNTRGNIVSTFKHVQVPAIVNIVASDTGAQVGAGQDDTVTINFDINTNQNAIAPGDIAALFSLSEGSWGTPANGLSAEWTSAKQLVITLGSDATVKKAATVIVNQSAGIKDALGNSASNAGSSIIDGTFGSRVPAIATITAADTGSQVGAGAGDTITIVLDTATNQPALALEDLELSAGSLGTAANGAAISWIDAKTLVITLGSDATVKKGATLSFAASAGLKDIGLESAISTANGTIDGTFGSQVPAITSITAADTGSQVGAGTGDKVTIVFDAPTNQPTVELADLVLNDGSFGTVVNGASIAWTDSTTLVVTLGSDATVKKDATITVAASANIKDIGLESLASTASGTIVGTFGSQVPDITSITAVNTGNQVGAGLGDKVTIVFNAPTNQPTVDLAHLVLSEGSFGTAVNGATVAWTDATTLVVTLGSDATVKKAATITISALASIKDIGLESAVSTASGTVDGTFGSQVPGITTITAANAGIQVGAGAGDTVTIVFDAPTNQPVVNLTDLVLSEGSFGTTANGAAVAWTNATTLVVTLGSDATVRKGAGLTIAASAGIKDIGLESAVSTAGGTISGTFGMGSVPAISTVTAADTGSQVGAGAGDKVTILFDTTTNQPAVNLGHLVLSEGSFGTTGNGATVAWTNATTLVVTLGSDATVKKGTTITIAASANIKDIGEESAASTASSAIAGTFGSQVPDITSITAVNTGNQVGAGAGDKVTIVFDTTTNQPAVSLADLVLNAGSFGTAGNGAGVEWSDAKTLVLTLGSDATVKKDATITISALAGIKDIGLESAASIASGTIGGTFGSQVPGISTITAVDDGSQVGAGAGDKVTIIFNVPTNQPAVDLADLALSEGSFGTTGNGAAIAWTNATTLVVTLGSDATVRKGAQLTLAASAGIKDIGLESAVSTAGGTIEGTFGMGSVPAISSITAADTGNQVGSGLADTITIVMDSATNQPVIALADLVLSEGSFGTTANGAGIAWTNATTLVVTLGSDATVKKDATITFAASANIRDIGAESDASTASGMIGGTFGSLVPAITSITAADTGSQVGAGTGDKVTIVFNAPTNQPAVELADLVLSDGSFGTAANGAAIAWTDATTLVVTLGSDATVKRGATITVAASANIKDIGLESTASTATGTIGGTFGSQVPAITSITAVNTGNQVGAGAGDKVTIVFDAPTNQPTVDLADLILSDGSFGTAVNGAATAWTNATTLVVTLGSDATVKKDATITISASAGIKDIGLESAASIASGTIGGTFGSQVPGISTITAVDDGSQVGAGAGDKVTIIFNVPTNQPAIDLADLVLSKGSFGTTGNGAAIAWTSATTLVVTLGSDATVRKGAQLTLAASAGIKDIGLESAVSTADGTIAGTFGMGSVPAVSSITAANTGNQVGAGIGDTVTIVLDTATNQPDITLADLVLSEGSIGTTANGAAITWTNATTLVVTLGSDAAVRKGATITFAASANIRDLSEESAVSTAGGFIGGTFGIGAVPVVAGIQATNDMGGPGPESGDKVEIIFTAITNTPLIDLSDVALNNGHTWGTGAAAAWNSTGSSLLITLGNDATVEVGDYVTISAAAGITEVSGELAAITAAEPITGTFGNVIIPAISNIIATNGGGTAAVEQNDTLEIIFNVPTNGGVVDLSKLVVSNGHHLGTSPSALWSSDNRTLSISLGSNPTIAITDTIDILQGIGIMDATGKAEIASRANISLNGSFGEATAPLVTAINAINGDGTALVAANDKLAIIFDTPVKLDDFSLDNVLADGIANAFGSTATYALDASNTTLTITFNGSGIAVTESSVITINGGIYDLATGTQALANGGLLPTTGGSFGTAAAPQAISTYATNGDGKATVGAGDTLVVVFDTPTNGGTVDLTSIILSNGQTLGENPGQAWSSDYTRLTLTLGAGTDITTADTLTINSGSGIQDATGQTPLATTAALSIGGSFGVAVAPVVSSVTAINGDGKASVGEGDKLVFVLDSPSNGAAVDLTKFSISGGHQWGTGAAASWSSDHLRLTVTLGTNTTITKSDSITIALGSGIADWTGQAPLAATAALSIGGSFGVAVAPVVSSTTAVNGDGKPGVGAGDKLLIVFDTPTYGGTVDLTKISVSNGHTLGTDAEYSWSANNAHLTITLGSNPTIVAGDKLSFLASSGITDATNQAELTTQTNISISGSFGEATAPLVTAINAINGDGTALVAANDKLAIIFDTPVKLDDFSLDNVLADGIANAFGSTATYVLDASNTTLTITFNGSGIAVTESSVITINGGIYDLATGTQVLANGGLLPAIGGSFGTAAAPQAISTYATNGDGKATVGAGDTLVVVFDTPTNGGTVDLTSIMLSNGHTLGENPGQAWSSDHTRLTLTLGAGTDITTADTLTINSGSGIQDATGQTPLATTAALSIGGSFGVAVAPVVSSVTAINGDGKSTVGEGDKLVFVLDSPSNGAAVDLTKFSISGGHQWGTGAAASWSSDHLRLTVTLGAGTTITKSDSITIALGSGIADWTGQAPLEATAALSIGGSFGAAAAPVVSSITAVNGDGKPGVGAGDKLLIVFDTPAYGGTVDLTKISVSNGHTLGEDAEYSWSANNAHLTITLGSNPTIVAGDKLSILASSGITDATNQAELTTQTNISISGSFGEATAPRVTAINAIDGDGTALVTAGDKLTIIFDTPVKLDGFSLDQVLVDGAANALGSTSTYALDSTKTVLTITFNGSGIAVTNSSVLTITGGIYDLATGTQALSNGTALPSIGGSFGTAVAPNVLSAIAIDQNGLESIYGDKLIITFDSPTNGAAPNDYLTKDLIQVINASNHTIGNYASFNWSNNNRTLTITLATYGQSVTDAVYANLQIGDILDLSGLGIKDATGTAPANASSVPISGSFVPGILPQFTNAVATTNNRNPAANILGTIEIIFSTVMHQEPGTVDLAKILVSDSHTFGTGATAVWSSGNVLSITVKTDATIQIGDLIDLKLLNLKDSNGIAYLPANDAVQSLTGSFGSALTPSVVSVVAANTGMNPGAGVGDKITITFSADTNGLADTSLDVSTLSGLIGADASAKWLNPRTLVITVGNLGANPVLMDNAEITLDSLNIRDLTGTSQAVQGTYVIGGTFGQANIPSVISIVASSNNKSKAESVISNEDIITITFDVPTNQSGEWNKTTVNQFVRFGSVSLPKILGADYKGVWKNNGKVLEITVIDVTGSTIEIGDSIQVHGIKNAMGTSPVSDDTLALTGIFDGREFAISSSTLTTGTAGTLTAKLTIQTVKGHSGNEVVIFEIKKGITPIQLIASEMDINGNVQINQTFSNLTGDLSQYTVEAYIFDNVNSISASQLLSQKIVLKLN
ncbi:beta strand repeat-containing protein [Paenibacillus eucommiae]|uniref:Sorbitol-specific phosphotransferase system component IIA n=1 Tax=Paenibacillus eucommiae TaxID=1355755 RepID=A0ABS4IWG2_9BACL|nr:hypothetical protein [Paenibacillus eucommiae]MBP1991932.1 sorbitol-specific phosphotransferase system component IIA [Paenibacillus eucommiae]